MPPVRAPCGGIGNLGSVNAILRVMGVLAEARTAWGAELMNLMRSCIIHGGEEGSEAGGGGIGRQGFPSSRRR